MTLSPPPSYTKDGDLLYVTDADILRRYADMAAMKSRRLVYVEERLDVSRDPETSTCFRMLLRCMSSEADLELIFSAASALGLVGAHWRVEEGYEEALSERYEHSYVEVRYESGTYIQSLDDEEFRALPVYLSAFERKRIWMGLFEAAGYKVKWGNALNVRRRAL